jgi:hypothetical protein
MRFRPVLFGVMVTLTCGGFFACGSRTALPGDFDAVTTGNDDSGSDARKPRDSGPDTAIPPIDARPPFDASRLDCPDASATLIYLITQDNQLLSFYPPSASFTLIGTIACPDNNQVNGGIAAPFSMAVDRRGTAYVEFNDGNIFKVSTATAACAATAFVAQTDNFIGFGMGFSTNGSGPTETLYIAGGQTISTTASQDFASIDVTDYSVTDIGPFTPAINDAELAGTGDGRLFAMSAFDTQAADTTISEIDKTTGNVTGSDVVPGVIFGGAWAFGFWGGDFYTYTQPGGGANPTVVTQYDPITKNATVVAGYPSAIVGAGVSTCAPQ